mgnify:CR=1 FL=1
MKVKEYNQMMSYLTRPRTQKDRFKKIYEKNNPDNSPYMLNNGELMTENEFKKSLPIEDQPGYNPDKDPNLLRRIIYTYFRDSKAKKSYEYSIKIGNFTPKPIGYIEFYKNYLIDESYFISEKFDYDFTIREPLLDSNFEKREEIFQAFARFTYSLHQNGILHQDYSPGNILIKKDGNEFILKIVDINRMEFRELSLNECLKNFNTLWAKDDDIRIIVQV